VVGQEPVKGSEALENLRVGGELLAHFGEGPDDEQAHLDRFRAVEDGCCHNCPMLGEGMGQILDVLPPVQGRKLRP
jgi:hypothetical protein